MNEKDPERDRYLGVEDLFRQEEEEEGRGFICIHRKLVKLTARHSSLTRVRAAPVSVVDWPDNPPTHFDHQWRTALVSPGATLARGC